MSTSRNDPYFKKFKITHRFAEARIRRHCRVNRAKWKSWSPLRMCSDNALTTRFLKINHNYIGPFIYHLVVKPNADPIANNETNKSSVQHFQVFFSIMQWHIFDNAVSTHYKYFCLYSCKRIQKHTLLYIFIKRRNSSIITVTVFNHRILWKISNMFKICNRNTVPDVAKRSW